MQIKAHQPRYVKQQFSSQAASARQESIPDSTTLESSASNFELGVAGAMMGGIGVGVPSAMVMGGVKLAINGNLGYGIALGVAGAAVGAVSVPISLMPAAMSTATGATAGFHGYLAGAGIAAAGTGAALFF